MSFIEFVGQTQVFEMHNLKVFGVFMGFQ